MVSTETRKRRSKRRQTLADLEAENTRLRQRIAALEKEASHDQRKANHGCTNFSCELCDTY